MTPEQRLDRAERILIAMAKSGRRTRTEWQYKINSLIDAQIRHEATWRMESAKIDAQLMEVAVAQAQNERARAESQKLTEKAIADLAESQKVTEKTLSESIAELTESQKLTEKALRAFIDSLRKGRNGNSI